MKHLNRKNNINVLCKQQGVALITILFVFAIATVMISHITMRQHLDIERTSHLLEFQQAYHYALGGEEYVRQVLYKDYENDIENNQRTDSLKEEWALLKKGFDIDNGLLEITIEDMHARFNLNSLLKANGTSNGLARTQFINLLDEVSVDSVIADELIDWLDSDSERINNGAEDETYLAKPSPYRTANNNLSHVTELRLLNSMDNDMYQALAAHITVMPAEETINVNTASETVLASLDQEITAEIAEKIVKSREQQIFTTVDNFLAHESLAGLGLKSTGLSVKSTYFKVNIHAQYASQHSYVVSVIARDNRGQLQLISRDFSQRFSLAAKHHEDEDEDE